MHTAFTKCPQQIEQSDFIASATLIKLNNHGRDWEVFLDGKSLGFADGARMRP